MKTMATARARCLGRRPVPQWWIVREERAARKAEVTARSLVRSLVSRRDMSERAGGTEIEGLGAWERRVLEAILILGAHVSDETLLNRLRKKEGHASLSMRSLLIALQRLEARGHLRHEYHEGTGKRAGHRLRYWVASAQQ